MTQPKHPGPAPRLPRDGTIPLAYQRQFARWAADAVLYWEALNEHVLERGMTDRDDGYPHGAGERTSGGDTSDPTVRWVLAHLGPDSDEKTSDEWRSDPVRLHMAMYVRASELLRNSLLLLLASGAQIKALPRRDAQRLLEQRESSTQCGNPACPIVVAGTRADRIRSGRCRGCYEHRRTHNGTERSRALCLAEAVRRGQVTERAAEEVLGAMSEPEGPTAEFRAEMRAHQQEAS